MSEDPDFQTEHAAKSAHLKSTFDTAVKGIFTEHEVDLTPPEESTGGGVRARLHMSLTGKDDRSAERRTLGCALGISKERPGNEMPIPAPEYIKFLDRATDVPRTFGLEVSVVPTVKTK